MIKNCNVALNDEGNIVITIPYGVTSNMSKEERYNQLIKLVDGVDKKDYTDSKGNTTTYYYISSLSSDKARGKYHSLPIEGIETRMAFDFVLTSDAIEEVNPNKVPDKTIKKGNSKVTTSQLTLAQAEDMLKKKYITREQLTQMILEGKIAG